MLSRGEMNLRCILGADISWKDLGDRIWKSGGRSEYRGQRRVELKECISSSLKDSTKIDMYGNKETIYGTIPMQRGTINREETGMKSRQKGLKVYRS